MNINVATWGRLLKKNINMKNNLGQEQRGLEIDPMQGRKRNNVVFFFLHITIFTKPTICFIFKSNFSGAEFSNRLIIESKM